MNFLLIVVNYVNFPPYSEPFDLKKSDSCDSFVVCIYKVSRSTGNEKQ